METPDPQAGRGVRHQGISVPRKICYALLVTILFFGGLEVAMRALGWQGQNMPTVGQRRFVTWLSDLSVTDPLSGPLYRSDERLLWSLVPSSRVKAVIQHRARQGEEQEIEITINAKGYRGPEVQPEASPSNYRVLCLGDSNFFGYPLDDRHAFPSVLQESLSRLRPEQRFEVINGGVPGYSVVQGRLFFDDLFAEHRWDAVLISFLNNDAWIQPLSDEENLRRQGSLPTRFARVAGHSRIVQVAGRMVPGRSGPRVPLPAFLDRYEELVRTVEQSGTRVLILDFRAYPEYQPYSGGLEELSRRLGLSYVPVAERIRAALDQGQVHDLYPELALRVQRRWGSMLESRPYLRLYAEYYPEHLNEVGAAWLADQMAPAILSESVPSVPED